MTRFHILLGTAVLVLNGVGGGLAIARGPEEPDLPAVAVWGHIALAVQLASGFFLFTSTSDDPGILHYVLPGASVAGIALARGVRGDGRNRAVGIASLAAAAVALFALVSGLTRG